MIFFYINLICDNKINHKSKSQMNVYNKFPFTFFKYSFFFFPFFIGVNHAFSNGNAGIPSNSDGFCLLELSDNDHYNTLGSPEVVLNDNNNDDNHLDFFLEYFKKPRFMIEFFEENKLGNQIKNKLKSTYLFTEHSDYFVNITADSQVNNSLRTIFDKIDCLKIYEPQTNAINFNQKISSNSYIFKNKCKYEELSTFIEANSAYEGNLDSKIYTKVFCEDLKKFKTKYLEFRKGIKKFPIVIPRKKESVWGLNFEDSDNLKYCYYGYDKKGSIQRLLGILHCNTRLFTISNNLALIYMENNEVQNSPIVENKESHKYRVAIIDAKRESDINKCMEKAFLLERDIVLIYKERKNNSFGKEEKYPLANPVFNKKLSLKNCTGLSFPKEIAEFDLKNKASYPRKYNNSKSIILCQKGYEISKVLRKLKIEQIGWKVLRFQQEKELPTSEENYKKIGETIIKHLDKINPCHRSNIHFYLPKYLGDYNKYMNTMAIALKDNFLIRQFAENYLIEIQVFDRPHRIENRSLKQFPFSNEKGLFIQVANNYKNNDGDFARVLEFTSWEAYMSAHVKREKVVWNLYFKNNNKFGRRVNQYIQGLNDTQFLRKPSIKATLIEAPSNKILLDEVLKEINKNDDSSSEYSFIFLSIEELESDVDLTDRMIPIIENSGKTIFPFVFDENVHQYRSMEREIQNCINMIEKKRKHQKSLKYHQKKLKNQEESKTNDTSSNDSSNNKFYSFYYLLKNKKNAGKINKAFITNLSGGEHFWYDHILNTKNLIDAIEGNLSSYEDFISSSEDKKRILNKFEEIQKNKEIGGFLNSLKDKLNSL